MNDYNNEFYKLYYGKNSKVSKEEYLSLISKIEIEKEYISIDTPSEAYMIGCLYYALFLLDINDFTYAEKGIEYLKIYFNSGCYSENGMAIYIFLLTTTWQYEEAYEVLKELESKKLYEDFVLKELSEPVYCAHEIMSYDDYKKYALMHFEKIKTEYNFQKNTLEMLVKE